MDAILNNYKYTLIDQKSCLCYSYITDTNISPLLLNKLIINNNVVPIEITEAFAKKPLGMKGLNIFSTIVIGVVYIA